MTSMANATLTLPSDTQILITREFAAPRHLVWRAYTEPGLMRRWWHAGRGEMTACEIDLRVGGAYRFAMITPDGMEVAFHGEFTEILPEERLVSTEHYEGAPDAPPVLNTVTLTERDGRTHYELVMETGSQQARDMIISTGMEDGLQDALDLLEQVAISEAT